MKCARCKTFPAYRDSCFCYLCRYEAQNRVILHGGMYDLRTAKEITGWHLSRQRVDDTSWESRTRRCFPHLKQVLNGHTYMVTRSDVWNFIVHNGVKHHFATADEALAYAQEHGSANYTVESNVNGKWDAVENIMGGTV